MDYLLRTNRNVTVVEMSGKIVLGGGTGKVREVISKCLEQGAANLLLDMEKVTYIDSAGLGELVAAYTTVINRGGKLKLLKPASKVHDVMQITKLATVFEIYNNEPVAVLSFL